MRLMADASNGYQMVDQCMQRAGLTRANVALVIFGSTIYLLLVLVFIVYGYLAFNVGSSFGAVVASFLPIGASFLFQGAPLSQGSDTSSDTKKIANKVVKFLWRSRETIEESDSSSDEGASSSGSDSESSWSTSSNEGITTSTA